MAPMKRPVCRQAVPTCSLTHLAQRWRVSRRRVRELLGKYRLPFEQIDGQIRVPIASVREWESQTPAVGISSQVRN